MSAALVRGEPSSAAGLFDRPNCFVEAIDASRAAGSGPLAGLTYAAKDMFDTPGRAPTLGLAVPPGAPPSGRAALLSALDAAGARFVGFTQMTALAYEPSGANADRGRPRNPAAPDRICGGSSSGSAVAVAAGHCDVAIGSDTAGSLRIPAQACGIAAWKPGPGLVPDAGAMPLAPSLDTLGFLARDVATLDRVASLFAPVPPAPVRTVALAADVLGESEAIVAAAIGQLRPKLPATIDVALRPLLDACDEPCLTILQVEAACSHAALLAGGRLDPILARRLLKGGDVPVARIEAAYALMRRLRAEDPRALLGGADAVLLPVMRMPTPRIETCEPGSPAFSPRVLYGLSALTRFVNLLGWPAVAVPAGFDAEGAPLAAQLVGPPGSDRALLALARTLAPSGGTEGDQT